MALLKRKSEDRDTAPQSHEIFPEDPTRYPVRSLPSSWPGPHFSELDCLHQLLPSEILRAAQERSAATGVGADRVLVQGGFISEKGYLDRLAFETGIKVQNFERLGREACPLDDRHIAYVLTNGLLPIREDGELHWVISPRLYGARTLTRLVANYPELNQRLRLACHSQIRDYCMQQAAGSLDEAAAHGLAKRSPAMSAQRLVTTATARYRHVAGYLARVIPLGFLFATVPMLLVDGCGVLLALWFLAFTVLRIAGCMARPAKKPSLPRLGDDSLPVYTIIAALYREAASVAALMQSIEALDYPSEKLDIIFAVELDDLQTRAAIARLGPRPNVQVITAPAIGPRTKPKALNYALSFARGSFITVFDAEDRPEANQLRSALDAFRAHDSDVACVQASLCIDNTSDGWLPRMFTAEYAGQFDVFLQGFSRFEMPLPLGGSSNHFRTGMLRRVGGWDAYNVTEDADLGFRLARFGYRSVMFDSTTFEEAPSRFSGWLRQRSRWMKGWLQTWSVHMRSPRHLWRDTGARGFFALNLIVGGNVLTALAHAVMLGEIMVRSLWHALDGSVPSWFSSQFVSLYLATIATGYASTVAIGLIGLLRRGLLRESWILLLTPVYWICLSIAAWRGLLQFIYDPYHWEKTEHGLAKTSRLGSRPSLALPKRRRPSHHLK